MKVGDCYIQHQRLRERARRERRAELVERVALTVATVVLCGIFFHMTGWALDHPANMEPSIEEWKATG